MAFVAFVVEMLGSRDVRILGEGFIEALDVGCLAFGVKRLALSVRR